MKSKNLYRNRDLSWLAFNYRVLQEAKDPSVPLLERLKFMAIFSSNLEEFFRVRIAYIRSLLELSKKAKKNLDFDPEAILLQLRNVINQHQEEYTQIFEHQILTELADHHIFIKKYATLTADQRDFVFDFYKRNESLFGYPVLLSKQIIRPSLRNAALYLVATLQTREAQPETRFAVFSIPSDLLPRFLKLPTDDPERHEIILLDDVVRLTIPMRVPDYQCFGAYSIKLTRDAELYIDDEFSGNLVEKIKSSLAKRNVGPAARFVYDRATPSFLLDYLKDCWGLGNFDLFPEGSIHNNFDFFAFPHFDMKHLQNEELPPLPLPSLNLESNLFDQIRRQDHLLHLPYHAYDPVVQLFEQAADDPDVSEIKIVQYRVAKQSRIMDALVRAAKNGKKVVAFVEIKARFDEESNLIWADRLQQAGVKVIYSFAGLKVHAKLAWFKRKEQQKNHLYCYIATGNFHEKTAKIYSDFGIFTHNPAITKEVEAVFDYLETQKKAKESPFKNLWVGQFNLREALIQHIENEIQNAKKRLDAHIVLKMNSLEDREIIDKLYEASKAGVEVKLIVRGICCLIPGVKGMSENIEIISIVDRYLEHARVFIFHNNGDEVVYMASADLMRRNLSYRIEVAFPVLEPTIRQQIKDFLRIQLADNTKARLVDAGLNNFYKHVASTEKVQAQLATYEYLKQQLEDNIRRD